LRSAGLSGLRIWLGCRACLTPASSGSPRSSCNWRRNGRFPDEEADLAPAVVRHLAGQVGVRVEALEDYEWTGRTGRRHRRLVLDRLAVASFDERAEARLRTWLSDELLPREPTPPALEGEVNAWWNVLASSRRRAVGMRR